LADVVAAGQTTSLQRSPLHTGNPNFNQHAGTGKLENAAAHKRVSKFAFALWFNQINLFCSHSKQDDVLSFP
jgi:hypothetical protein